ncbi:MAG: RdgB/HAM1 family non-canonical purine NTP pyrophosphatase [Chloroflexi bacterium]|nr:RdgB/HAM1 family non-canonical purine NTP pyrophosphatase [Chloroflexota bacterium]
MYDKLLLATINPHKTREYRSLLEGIPYDLVTLADVGINHVASEVGQTMEENARIKAADYSARSGLLTMADDSGLEVNALGGAPGVYSARFAGEGATDSDRIKLLLERLAGVPWEKRAARFRCVICLSEPGGEVCTCPGECRGLITFEPRGSEGFGYDPVFFFPELGKTMAELPMDVKNRVSHRGQAARLARQALEKLKGSRGG